MAADVATLTLRADISELQRKLKSIPGDADGQAKQMAVSLERAFKRAEKASTDAARNSAKAQSQAVKDAARAADQANREIGEGLKGLGELAGLPVDKIEKLGKAFGLAGGTFGAIAGGAALATLAIAGAAAAVFSVVDAAIDLEKEIGPLRAQGLLPPLDPAWATNLSEAEQSMAGAKIATQSLVVQVGGQLAPAIEYAAIMAGKMATEIGESGPVFTAFGQVLKSGVIVYLQTVADWGLAIPTIFANMAKVVGGALSAIGMDGAGSALTGLADGFLDFKNSIGSNVVNAALDNYAIGLQLMGREADIDGAALRNLGDAALALGDKQAGAKKSADASKQAVAADKERAAAMAKIRGIAEATEAASASAERKLGMAAAKQIEQLNEIAAKYADQPDIAQAAADAEYAVREQLAAALDSLRESEDTKYAEARAKQIADETRKRIDAEKQVHDKRMADAQAFAGASATFAGGFSDLLAMQAENTAKTDKERALRQFKASKGAAVAEATINGAVAITRALATLGPVAGALAAAGIGASTAAQVAVIASQKPSFDRGGMIQGGAAMADQVTINALPGEAVLSRQAVRSVGGQSGVDAINRGSAPGGPQVVMVPVYKHFGRFVQDELQRSSILQGAMLAGRTIGATGY